MVAYKKHRKRWARVWALVSLFLLSYSKNSKAQDEEKENRIVVKANTRTEYNDNIFLSPTDKQSELLVSLFPSVSLDLVTRLADIKLSYIPRIILPVKRFGDADVRRIIHAGQLAITSELTNGITLSLSDDLMAIPVNLGTPDNNDTSLVQTNRVSFEPKLLLELAGRMDVEVTLKGSRFDSSSGGASRTDVGGGIRVLREFTPQLTFGIRANEEHRFFDQAAINDVVNYGVQGEGLYQFSELLRLRVRGGIQWLSISGGRTAQDPSVDVELEYDRTERSKFSVAYQLGFVSDGAGNQLQSHQMKADTKWELTPRLGAQLEVGYRIFQDVEADAAVGVQNDSLFSVRPGLWYTLGDSLELNAGYSWSINRGENVANDFDQNLFFIGANYTLRDFAL